MVELNQLANALALQEFGSFRRAAEAQRISQPAFSRSIQQLESCKRQYQEVNFGHPLSTGGLT